MLETRERVLYTNAQRGEALIVQATLRCEYCADFGRIKLIRSEAALDAVISGVCYVPQQKERRLQIDRAREIERGGLRASARAVAHIDVAEAS